MSSLDSWIDKSELEKLTASLISPRKQEKEDPKSVDPPEEVEQPSEEVSEDLPEDEPEAIEESLPSPPEGEQEEPAEENKGRTIILRPDEQGRLHIPGLEVSETPEAAESESSEEPEAQESESIPGKLGESILPAFDPSPEAPLDLDELDDPEESTSEEEPPELVESEEEEADEDEADDVEGSLDDNDLMPLEPSPPRVSEALAAARHQAEEHGLLKRIVINDPPENDSPPPLPPDIPGPETLPPPPEPEPEPVEIPLPDFADQTLPQRLATFEDWVAEETKGRDFLICDIDGYRMHPTSKEEEKVPSHAEAAVQLGSILETAGLAHMPAEGDQWVCVLQAMSGVGGITVTFIAPDQLSMVKAGMIRSQLQLALAG